MSARLKELDGMRGIAALIVVTFHFFYLYDFKYGHDFEIPIWIRYGYLGVHLFFIISGFVIFWTLSRIERPFDFIWSRFSRLFPVYIVAVVLTFTIVTIFGLKGKVVGVDVFLVNLTMLQDFVRVERVDGSYWSLSFELAFYLVMFLFFVTRQLSKIEYFLIFWVLLSFYIMQQLKGDVDPIFDRQSPWLILFMFKYFYLFAAGICFYKIWANKATQLTWLALGVVILNILLMTNLVVKCILISFCIVFYLAISSKLKFLGIKVFTFFGTISYSLYLVHQYIGYVIINLGYQAGISSYLTIAMAYTVTFVLACLLTFYIERPCLVYLKALYKENKKVQV